LLDPTIRAKYSHVFLSSSHNAYAALVAKNKALKDSKEKQEKKSTVSQSDDLIQFRQLRIQAVQGGIEVDLMDADDICLPDRFIHQILFMEANPTVVISGGAMYLMSEDSPALKPAVTSNLQKQLMLQNVFNHPTIILRRELIESGDFKYSPRFKHTEDYRLWTKLAYKVKMENLEIPLIYFRANKAASKSNSARAPIRREIEIVLIRLLFLGRLIIIRKCHPTDIRHFFATIVRSSVPSIVRSIHIRRRGSQSHA
jgi:hypothetical protein